MKKILFLLLTLCSSAGLVYSDISWQAPTAISTALTDASDPRVVIDSNNNATSIWIENDIVMASSLPSGGSWTTPVAISDILNTSSNPLLGVDSSGNVTAVWIEDTLILSATLPFAGSWSAATTVSGAGAGDPALAVDSSGNAVAVWTRSGFIESSTRISGTWSLVSVLSAANSDNPDVAISSFGIALATWHNLTSGIHYIVTDQLTISSNTWAATKNVFPGAGARLHDYPKIALDDDGNASVAWFRYDTLNGNGFQNVQVLISNLTAGSSSWGLPTILSDTGLRNPADLTIKLQFDTSGNGLIVWINSYDGETFTIESSQKLFGGVWLDATLPDVPSLYSFAMDVASASGTSLLVYMRWDEISALQIISQETNTTNPVLQAWTIPAIFSTGDNNAFPSCGLSVTGSTFNAVAVWVSFDGVNNVIHSSIGVGVVITPPSNVSATQNVTDFGVYQDYYNTITWNATTDPDPLQYNIYRNGVYFAATDSSTLQFIDNNTTQNGEVTYGISVMMSDFRVSDIESFTLFP